MIITETEGLFDHLLNKFSKEFSIYFEMKKTNDLYSGDILDSLHILNINFTRI